MKYYILFILLLATVNSIAQIKVPSGFQYIKGESPVGRDDYYKNGEYILVLDNPFQADPPANSDDRIKARLSDIYGVAFNKTSDGLFYGTGYSDGRFKYIVMAQELAFILSAKTNGDTFSNYSVWLLKSIRSAIAQNKELYFQ